MSTHRSAVVSALPAVQASSKQAAQPRTAARAQPNSQQAFAMQQSTSKPHTAFSPDCLRQRAQLRCNITARGRKAAKVAERKVQHAHWATAAAAAAAAAACLCIPMAHTAPVCLLCCAGLHDNILLRLARRSSAHVQSLALAASDASGAKRPCLLWKHAQLQLLPLPHHANAAQEAIDAQLAASCRAKQMQRAPRFMESLARWC